MKKIFSLLPISVVSLFLLSSTCKKDDVSGQPPGGGPGVALPTNGYLVTMGTGSNGITDTMTYYFSTGGQELTVYGREFLRDKDEINMENNSNGTMTIEKKIPYTHQDKNYRWFGIELNASPDFSSFPDNKYLFHFYHPNESELTQFIIKRNDGEKQKFTIESKAYPGYFLGVAKWKNATYPTTDRLVFTTKQHVFWLVQK